jgi:hypothetical protein
MSASNTADHRACMHIPDAVRRIHHRDSKGRRRLAHDKASARSWSRTTPDKIRMFMETRRLNLVQPGNRSKTSAAA